nr:hypothetical protein Iba_chr10aCG3650 [Ipomoea batatas]GME17295.1 hypothetical protein Iba_scaffold18470CG0010 [Ipomoea batatas]
MHHLQHLLKVQLIILLLLLRRRRIGNEMIQHLALDSLDELQLWLAVVVWPYGHYFRIVDAAVLLGTQVRFAATIIAAPLPSPPPTASRISSFSAINHLFS